MIVHPAVMVHGLDQARAALRPGRPVTLLSSRGAALFAGCLWWRALVEQARAEFPAVDVADVLDCADAPGHAMAALRIGQRLLVLDAACPAWARVAAAAATLGATLLARAPPALDLGLFDQRRADPVGALPQTPPGLCPGPTKGHKALGTQ
jgi:hypothetical protein